MKKLITILLLAFTLNAVSQIAPATVKGLGTINYLPLWTGTKTIRNSVVYQSNGNVGINNLNPLAKLSLKSDDISMYNFLFRSQNNVDQSIFEIRNDGAVGVGGTSIYSNYALQIIPTATSKGLQIIGNGVGSVLLQTSSDNASGFLSLRSQLLGYDGVVLNGNGNSFVMGSFGVGVNPTAKFHVSGTVSFDALPIYNVSLPSGQIYKYSSTSPSGYSIGIMP